MRISIITFFLLIFSQLSAQDCEITVQGDVPSCPGSPLILSVEESDTLNYHWVPGDYTTPSIVVRPEDTTTYYVHVFNSNFDCQDSVTIDVYHQIEVEFDQLEKTCTGADADCQAQVKAIASGEFTPEEYSYIWEVQFVDPSDSSLALGLCGDLYYDIRIKDKHGCYIDTSYKVNSFRSPEIRIGVEPDSIIYTKNPWITLFYFENLSIDTLGLTNWYWQFGDDTTNTSSALEPRHLFDEAKDTKQDTTIMVNLTITDDNGCDTTYTYPITIKPVKLFIPNAFIPRSTNLVNSKFIITREDDKDDNIRDINPINHYYDRNKLIVFNRYGRLVFEASNYDNDWDGGNLPEGVYFYILECTGEFGIDTFKGSVTIFR